MGITRVQYVPTSKKMIGMCADYIARREAMNKARWDWVKEQGATGLRPNGLGISTLFFPEESIPAAWKPVAKRDAHTKPGLVECTPNRKTKEGRRLAKLMRDGGNGTGELKAIRDVFPSAVTKELGRNRMTVSKDGRIADPRVIKVLHPKEVYIIDLPFDSDEQPLRRRGLKELRASEFHKLIEGHNDALKTTPGIR